MIDLPTLELATALLTAGAALTLIPHSRHLLGSTVEFVVWIGFVLSSGLCIATFGNPRAQEATAAIAWGAIGLIRVQASSVLTPVGGWTGTHRFAIASWIAIAVGVQIFALAFIATLRAAHRSAPRVHLAEWLELPSLVPQPAYVPAANPLAAIDRKLAGAATTQLQRVARRLETSPALAKAAIGAAHVLRPGHLRLMMVKVALSTQWRREDLGRTGLPAGGTPVINSRPKTLTQSAAQTRSQGRRHPERDARRRAPSTRSAGRMSNREAGHAGAPGYRHRVAS